ncbi:MAG: tryptophan synthase subunit alpha [Spirochaetales bacterium]
MSRVMAHMIPFYPDRARSLAVAEGLIEGGAAYLEIQFPFSDPTADGPVIQAACQHALDQGFRVDEGFSFIAEIQAAANRIRGAQVPVFLMTYASLIYARGVDQFITDGVSAGCAGFILPDIPLDHDEGVFDAAQRHGAAIMPVSVTSARERRVTLLRERSPEYIYVALRRGITGAKTELGEENLSFLKRLAPTGAKIMAGFGISDRSQVEALEPFVHAAVVGSAFVRNVANHAAEAPAAITRALAEQTRSLVG